MHCLPSAQVGSAKRGILAHRAWLTVVEQTTGLLAPQLQEIDRAYEDIKVKQEAQEKVEAALTEERGRLEELERELGKRERIAKVSLQAP